MTTRSNLIFNSVTQWGPRAPYPATKLHRNGAAPNRGSLKQKNSETKGTWSSEMWNRKNPTNGKKIAVDNVHISTWSERWKMSDDDKSARYNIKFWNSASWVFFCHFKGWKSQLNTEASCPGATEIFFQGSQVFKSLQGFIPLIALHRDSSITRNDLTSQNHHYDKVPPMRWQYHAMSGRMIGEAICFRVCYINSTCIIISYDKYQVRVSTFAVKGVSYEDGTARGTFLCSLVFHFHLHIQTQFNKCAICWSSTVYISVIHSVIIGMPTPYLFIFQATF